MPLVRNFIIRWALGLALLALLVIFQIRGQGFGASLSQLNAGTIVAVLLLDVLVLLLATFRSHLLLRSLGYHLSRPLLFSSVTLGFVVGSITPAATGELLRVEALRMHGGVARQDSLAVIAFERVVSFYLMVMLALASGAVVLLPLGLALFSAAGLLALTFLPILMLSSIQQRLRVNKADRSSRNRIITYLWELADRFEQLADNRYAVASWLLTSIALLGVVAVQFWLLARGIGSGIGFELALFALTGSQVLGIVSLLPLGVGIADGSVVGILSPRLGSEGALAVAVMVRATITLPMIALAGAAYLYLTTRHVMDAARTRRLTQIAHPSDVA